MPLLMCPNDNAAMQTLQRAGVEFDMCPACRGVWLDRGELEKLMNASRAADEQAPPRDGERFSARPAQQRRAYDDNDDRDDRRRRRGGFDLFDIFD